MVAPFAVLGQGSVERGEESLGAAASCLAARRLGGNEACAEVARSRLHWLFGQNPFGISFMIGLGQTFPQNPQHSAGDALKFSVTGAIVGGPTSLATLMSDASEVTLLTTGPYLKWSTDALMYEDNMENYVTNEPAIDFEAPLLFVLGELLENPEM